MSKQPIKYFIHSDGEKSLSLRKLSNEKTETSKDTDLWVGDKNAFASYGYVFNEFQNVLGKVLTLVDATVQNEKQNKSMKDIIRNIFAEKYSQLSNNMLPEQIIDTANLHGFDYVSNIEEFNNIEEI